MFWKRPGVVAALTAAGVGLVVRLVFLALTPTLYGVPNDILYVPNDLIGAGFDGYATLVAAAIGFGTFVVVGFLAPRTPRELEGERSVRTELDREQQGALEPAGV
ncbi:hypothetical protein [Rathayibacter sp. VKM Ac-2835]|uniref:hypothetical protein n=1 Tax=Rathayibacter sp. VKM Ac-2835 TaxID=2739043 RepID=UPI0020B6B69D|nr:hypothetical protein [Rathayibacter sp. VKM Ac-2835]